MFLPASEGTLPHPGTPVPEFDALSTDGQSITKGAFAGVERVFATLSTGCETCLEQVSAFREYGASLALRPIVTIVGPPKEREPMVTRLDGHAVVIEERDNGPIADAFEISEFPAVLLVRNGVIQQAEHRLADVLPSLAPVAASADSPRQG